jgi:acyl-CoA carboxylase subunit beta
MNAHLDARGLIGLVLDHDTFTSWDTPIDASVPDATYRAQLERARARSGADEAVLTGAGRIQGQDVAVVVSEFGFLGGSIGRATARRIVAAVTRATGERLPLLVATSSGGTRMQEGTPAFVEMVAISRTVVAHKAAGLPYLVYLRHPTTGGVFASWGSLGHITAAEPGALIGFLGPRVFEALNGTPFPAGVQVAENLVDKGIIDAVVAPEDVAAVVGRVLRLLRPHRHQQTTVPRQPPPPPSRTTAAWESVLRTRRPDRPGVRELLALGADDVVPLSGTGDGERDAGLMLALTSFDGNPCVLIGQDRRNQSPQHSMGPAALREARRGMRLADELGIPVVTVIDTPGADLSPHAEEGALAGEIARCIADMSRLSVPSVAVLLGQGCGGGALALLPADRVIAAENAWLSPLPPEGASAIVYHDTEHAPLLAERQKISCLDLLEENIVHVVVPERPPAQENPQVFVQAIVAACASAMRELAAPGGRSAR